MLTHTRAHTPHSLPCGAASTHGQSLRSRQGILSLRPSHLHQPLTIRRHWKMRRVTRMKCCSRPPGRSPPLLLPTDSTSRQWTREENIRFGEHQAAPRPSSQNRARPSPPLRPLRTPTAAPIQTRPILSRARTPLGTTQAARYGYDGYDDCMTSCSPSASGCTRSWARVGDTSAAPPRG